MWRTLLAAIQWELIVLCMYIVCWYSRQLPAQLKGRFYTFGTYPTQAAFLAEVRRVRLLTEASMESVTGADPGAEYEYGGDGLRTDVGHRGFSAERHPQERRWQAEGGAQHLDSRWIEAE